MLLTDIEFKQLFLIQAIQNTNETTPSDYIKRINAMPSIIYLKRE